jgi:hypothetical protein
MNNMKTFYRIIQTHLGNKEIFFPDDSEYQCEYWSRFLKIPLTINNILFGQYILQVDKAISNRIKKQMIKPSNIIYKFFYLKQLLENMFLSEEKREELLQIFCKVQKTYRAFSKLVYLYKYKKAKIVISTDLELNTLSITERNVICLFQGTTKYLFRVYDLMKIINRSLSNSPNFFSSPLPIKNPYNNLEFTHIDLYTIYFFIRYRQFIMPPLFEKFYKANFNTSRFIKDNECFIRMVAIKNYVYSSHTTILYPAVKAMFYSYRAIIKKLTIDPDFPKEKLVNIMRPYLELYYINAYYIEGTTKHNESDRILKEKLKAFIRFNPRFGRKRLIPKLSYINLSDKSKYTCTVTFDDKHIPFHHCICHAPTSVTISGIDSIINVIEQFEFDSEEDEDESIDDMSTIDDDNSLTEEDEE